MAATVIILVIDGTLGREQRGLFVTAVTDETAHLLTTLVLVGGWAARLPPSFVAGALAGSVVIDLDHLPLVLGSDLLTETTARPLTHCLLVAAAPATLSLAVGPTARQALLGISAGLLAHFVRDAASSPAGVPLLWPLSPFGFTMPYTVYALLLVTASGASWLRRRLAERPAER